MSALQRDSEYLRKSRFGDASHIRGLEPRSVHVGDIRRQNVMSLQVVVEGPPQRVDVSKRASHAQAESTAYARPAFPEINQLGTNAGFCLTHPGVSSTHPSDLVEVRRSGGTPRT